MIDYGYVRRIYNNDSNFEGIIISQEETKHPVFFNFQST